MDCHQVGAGMVPKIPPHFYGYKQNHIPIIMEITLNLGSVGITFNMYNPLNLGNEDGGGKIILMINILHLCKYYTLAYTPYPMSQPYLPSLPQQSQPMPTLPLPPPF